ncbi:hypothetical protein M427DRAFT_482964 [Gonapodya prolifera JEL478]|uniref:F-box domain-containing protein n=1 Tax=Gonapodya prolifera (strain JEL478) TaxID=1344416 RepID=A0A139A0T9_GONPJ|nr:hypothetical protein M427DRAFT_482964 [Gonapodya prolifera JEL478]|eukprot:KXS10389.1 hypothetical protein M427DRAFT_482964 [Gonapodya prolifera JEL478]
MSGSARNDVAKLAEGVEGTGSIVELETSGPAVLGSAGAKPESMAGEMVLFALTTVNHSAYSRNGVPIQAEWGQYLPEVPLENGACPLMGMPKEVLVRVTEFVEDTDLQTLRHCSRLFLPLCSDPHLWRKHIYSRRHPPRLARLLHSLPQRPTRESLIAREILFAMCGVAAVARGEYIGGEGVTRQWEARRMLWWKLVGRKVDRALKRRPSVEEMRNLVPVEAVPSTIVFVNIGSSRSAGAPGSLQRSDSDRSSIITLDTTPFHDEDSGPATDDDTPAKPSTPCLVCHAPHTPPSSPPRVTSANLVPKIVDLGNAMRRDKLNRALQTRRSWAEMVSTESEVFKTYAVTIHSTPHLPLLAVQLQLSRNLLLSRLRRRDGASGPSASTTRTAPRSWIPRAMSDAVQRHVAYFEAQMCKWAPPAPEWEGRYRKGGRKSARK